MKFGSGALFNWNRMMRDKTSYELQFLPAALEIVETPPSPSGRALAASVIAFFTLAVAWTCIGEIDIVASAPGRIVPSGRTKLIQSYETGVIRAINVQDGQHVTKGDLLVELDPTINLADRDHQRGDLVAAKLEAARLRAIIANASDPVEAFNAPPEATLDQIAVQKQYLVAQIGEHHAKLAVLDRQYAQKEAEASTIRSSIAKIEGSIPVVQKRLQIHNGLKDYDRKLVYFEVLQQLTEYQGEAKVQSAHLDETKSAMGAILETRRQNSEEFRRTRLAELTEAERKVAGLIEDLAKAEQRARFQKLTAPVDGIVQQLAVHSVGGVVTPAQTLLVIVPSDTHLEIEALVSNRDIGFVSAGQTVQIKVDTFNFTRYGLLRGTVLSISPDAVTKDGGSDNANSAAATRNGPAQDRGGQQLAYSARVSLEATAMQVDDKLISLSPGMATTVEINTGSRRLISYLLSPLMKYRHESGRER